MRAALTELIDGLLETMAMFEGAIHAFDLHGVMTGPDRCTIWGQACIGTAGAVRRMELTDLAVEQAPGGVTISTVFRAEAWDTRC